MKSHQYVIKLLLNAVWVWFWGIWTRDFLRLRLVLLHLHHVHSLDFELLDELVVKESKDRLFEDLLQLVPVFIN